MKLHQQEEIQHENQLSSLTYSSASDTGSCNTFKMATATGDGDSESSTPRSSNTSTAPIPIGRKRRARVKAHLPGQRTIRMPQRRSNSNSSNFSNSDTNDTNDIGNTDGPRNSFSPLKGDLHVLLLQTSFFVLQFPQAGSAVTSLTAAPHRQSSNPTPRVVTAGSPARCRIGRPASCMPAY